MASKYLQKYPVPSGFQQILADFTRQVLRDQPPNIIEYAAKYFQMLEKGGKFQFNSKYNVSKDDKKHELNYNPKNAEDITKKASSIATRVQKDNDQPSKSNLNAGSKGDKQKVEKNQSQVTNLPPEIVVEIKKVFDDIDSNKNGYIESQEIKRAVQIIAQQNGINQNASEAQIRQFIQVVDSNHDGKISQTQFINFVASILVPLIGGMEAYVAGTQKTVNQQQVENYMNEQDQQVMYNQLKQQSDQIFDQIDVDRSNVISFKEMKKGVEKYFGQIDPELFNQFFQAMDENDDGRITRDELFEFIVKISNQM